MGFVNALRDPRRLVGKPPRGAAKLLVLNEHYCDFARLFPHVRALREQVDWPALHEVVGHSPFARSFLALCGELGIAES